MITVKDIKAIQSKKAKMNNVLEFKLLGLDTCDRFGLSANQSLDILNGRHKDIIRVLGGVKVDASGNVTYKLDNGTVIKLN